jgi:uncharacterized protein YoxC
MANNDYTDVMAHLILCADHAMSVRLKNTFLKLAGMTGSLKILNASIAQLARMANNDYTDVMAHLILCADHAMSVRLKNTFLKLAGMTGSLKILNASIAQLARMANNDYTDVMAHLILCADHAMSVRLKNTFLKLAGMTGSLKILNASIAQLARMANNDYTDVMAHLILCADHAMSVRLKNTFLKLAGMTGSLKILNASIAQLARMANNDYTDVMAHLILCADHAMSVRLKNTFLKLAGMTGSLKILNA